MMMMKMRIRMMMKMRIRMMMMIFLCVYPCQNARTERRGLLCDGRSLFFDFYPKAYSQMSACTVGA